MYNGPSQACGIKTRKKNPLMLKGLIRLFGFQIVFALLVLCDVILVKAELPPWCFYNKRQCERKVCVRRQMMNIRSKISSKKEGWRQSNNTCSTQTEKL